MPDDYSEEERWSWSEYRFDEYEGWDEPRDDWVMSGPMACGGTQFPVSRTGDGGGGGGTANSPARRVGAW